MAWEKPPALQVVFYTWSRQKAYKPFIISKAKGSNIWDDKGKKYLDFMSQLTNVNAGNLGVSISENDIKLDQKVFLVIRPETIRIGSSGEAAGVNKFKGTIKSCMYAGSMIKYTVDIKGKKIVVDQYDPSSLGIHDIGNKIMITIPQKVHILKQ